MATATTALQPELNLTQTTGFKTECVTPEVTDKEIDAVLERRRAMAAELVPHKVRPSRATSSTSTTRACWKASPSTAAPPRTRPCSWAAAG